MSEAPVLGPIGHLGDHAEIYADAGLEVFPVNPSDKTPLVSQHQATIEAATIAGWWGRWPEALIGHRIGHEHVLTDIDPRHGGDKVWRALRDEVGDAWPVTRSHQSGRGDGGGHSWWLRPAGKLSVRRLNDWAREHGIGEEHGTRWSAGIDLLHHDHRYTILPPSPHPETGAPYRWLPLRDLAIEPAPMPELLAVLLTEDPAPAPSVPLGPVLDLGGDSIADWFSASSSWGSLLARHGWTLVHGSGDDDGSQWRHPAATSAVSATIRHGCLFVYTPNTPFEPTEQGDVHGYTLFRAYATLEHAGDASAAARAARELKDGPRAPRQGVEVLIAQSSTSVDAASLPEEPSRFQMGGTWILDAPTQTPAIWGTGDEVLWAEGEPLLLTGPPGVGKTTLTGQLLRCRLGLQAELLGWPVVPETGGKVLYLASDRPAQIRRALGRTFKPEDRELLDERLVAWPGPPPADLAKRPEMLLQMAKEAGARTVVLDSLKDMAIGLADDEVGAGLNRSIQMAIADGVEVLALHHQRKGSDGKRPKTLEDLYGSTWISAGAGSVLLLWGAAGDLVVELHHLKQPSSDVGPMKLEHNHRDGITTIHRGFDLVAALRHSQKGLSALEVARMWLEKDKPNENERKKAQRRLDNLVQLRTAVRIEGERQSNGTVGAAIYRYVDGVEGLVGTPFSERAEK